MTDSLKETT